ncbi:MAG: hypothetical protein MI867_17055 [Pseudomonadales bacterium]|nr:hypothetical protein [Pseudomonadales bacterium]
MGHQDLSRYRNLVDLSDKEWNNLNIYLFIAANFSRYCSPLIKKIGAKYLPSDASETLLSLFCDVGYKPLASIHSKNLNTKGERRNQIMLGTLKMIATTRMVEAVIKEFPSYITLDQLPEASDDDYSRGLYEDDTTNSQNWPQPRFDAEQDGTSYEEVEYEALKNDERVSLMIEKIRSHLTPLQYQHLRYSICDGMSCNDIADITGHSATNVRIMLLNARKKMLELVPEHLTNDLANCLHRR